MDIAVLVRNLKSYTKVLTILTISCMCPTIKARYFISHLPVSFSENPAYFVCWKTKIFLSIICWRISISMDIDVAILIYCEGMCIKVSCGISKIYSEVRNWINIHWQEFCSFQFKNKPVRIIITIGAILIENKFNMITFYYSTSLNGLLIAEHILFHWCWSIHACI